MPLKTCSLQTKTLIHIDLDQEQYEESLEHIRGVEVSETDEEEELLAFSR